MIARRAAVLATNAIRARKRYQEFTAWPPLNRFGFAYYLLPALPFACVLVARLLCVLPRIPAARGIFVGASLALFAASYPVLAAVPLSKNLATRYERLTVLGPRR